MNIQDLAKIGLVVIIAIALYDKAVKPMLNKESASA